MQKPPSKSDFPEGTEFWLVGPDPVIPVAIKPSGATVAFDSDPPRFTMTASTVEFEGSEVSFEEWAASEYFSKIPQPSKVQLPSKSDFPEGTEFWLVGPRPDIPVAIKPSRACLAFDTDPPRSTMTASAARFEGDKVSFEGFAQAVKSCKEQAALGEISERGGGELSSRPEVSETVNTPASAGVSHLEADQPFGANNKIITRERHDAALARIREVVATQTLRNPNGYSIQGQWILDNMVALGYLDEHFWPSDGLPEIDPESAVYYVSKRQPEKLQQLERDLRRLKFEVTYGTPEDERSYIEFIRQRLLEPRAPGLDAELAARGLCYAAILINRGFASFPAFATEMIRNLGESVIPHLMSMYAARFDPSFEGLPIDSDLIAEAYLRERGWLRERVDGKKSDRSQQENENERDEIDGEAITVGDLFDSVGHKAVAAIDDKRNRTAARADAITSRIVNGTIRRLRKLTDCQMSGDDSILQNVWEEICVQAQGEYSVFWQAYVDTINSFLMSAVDALKTEDQEAVWLQSNAGQDWELENENNEADQNNDLGPPVVESEICDYLSDKLLAKAEDYENKNIRKFLERDFD